MIPPEAISSFTDRQKRLLRQTYDSAWAAGVSSYQPDPNPQQEPDVPQGQATAGLTGAALLAVRRLYNYVPPSEPDATLRAAALAPSFGGVDAMAASLSTFAPTVADAAASGLSGIASAAATFGSALADWASSNAYRLDNGDSVAWAGEQSGYAQAADTDGQLLEWQDEGDDRVCESCSVLGSMPPQPLADWPSQPGDGSTDCATGCRCCLVASDTQLVPGDTYAPQLTDQQQATASALTDARANTLTDMMPDAAYLE